MINYKHIAFIGLGLIASSIALAIKRTGQPLRVTGTSRSKSTRLKAKKMGLCEVFETSGEAVEGADLIVLCVPVGVMGEMVDQISPYLKCGSTVTDVGSVKESVIFQVLPKLPSGVFFLPGHPLAGTEHSGPESGIESLFDNRWCILTPLPETPGDKIDQLRNFWEALGANVEEMTPTHHDLVLAVTSHAPHLIAFTMVGVADDFSKVSKSEVINYSAAGFRDFTRIASSDPTMWRDVFLNNKEASLEILGRFTEELFALQSAIRRGDGQQLYD